jgi:hypothetical protein
MPTRLGLLEAFALSRLSWHELWLAYFSLGGNSPLPAMADEVAGLSGHDPREHDLIATALNERLLDLGLGRPVGYWTER